MRFIGEKRTCCSEIYSLKLYNFVFSFDHFKRLLIVVPIEEV